MPASTDTPAPSRDKQPDLEAQIAQLRTDLQTIAGTLATMAEDKVNETQRSARREVKNFVRSGQHMVEEVGDEFGHVERQIKDTIRERPLTAVLGAAALGYLLAVISR